MAIKPFNSVGGYSVGPNLTPFLDANNNANVANLTVNGDISGTIGNLQLTGNLSVDGQSNLNTLGVANAAVFDSTVDVGGVLTVTGNVDADANLNVANNAIIGGFANVTGILTVTANIDGAANLNLTGSADITGQLIVDGAATLGSTLDVTGIADFANAVGIDGILTVANAANITGTLTAGATTINGNLAISNASGTNGILTDNLYYSNGTPWDLQQAAGSNTQIQFNNAGDFGASANFTFDTATSEFTVTGTSNITGAATFGGTVTTAGKTTLNGELEVNNTSVFTDLVTISSGDLVVNDGLTTHGNVIMDAFTGGSITIGDNTNGTNVSISGANVTLGQLSNLHILGGSNGQYLSTNGSGNLTWTSLDTDTLANGTSNVSIDVADGPITMGVNGTANIAVFTATNANLAGNVNAVGTVTADTLYANTLANVLDLTVRGNANVAGTSNVVGAAAFGGTVNIEGALLANGAATFAGSTFNVEGDAAFDLTVQIDGALTVNDDATITGILGVTGNIDGSDNINLSGTANIGTNLLVGGNANVAGTANVVGATNLGSTLGVVGIATFGANIDGNVNLNLVGSANIVTDLLVGGNADIDGTINANGAATLGSTLDVTGIATFDSNVTVGTGTTLFFDTANGATLNATTGVTTLDLTVTGLTDLNDLGNITITGGANGQILSTDGLGNLTWTSTANINSIVNGTSNVSIPTTDGNVYVGVNGQANIITVQSNGTFATTTFVDDVLITGNLTVQGEVTNIDSTTLNVEDPVITEGRGPNNAPLTTNDGLDRGLYSWYYEGGVEKGGFVGYKNAGAFAGSYVVAKNATIADNTVTVTTYADVVVAGIVSGAAGNVSGTPVSKIDMGTGSEISFRVNSEASVLSITDADITANANVAVSGNVGVTGGNITVSGGTAGSYGSQIDLIASPAVGSGVTTTIGSATVVTASSTPTPIVTLGDALGRTVEFFISARDTANGNYEAAKYLVVSNGVDTADFTSYGTVRIGVQTVQVEVSFVADGTDLIARVAVLDNASLTQFSTQYQIIA